MSKPLLTIVPGMAYLHWSTPLPKDDEFDWDRHNNALNRLKAKIDRGDGITKIVVDKRKLWPDWFPDPAAVGRVMVDHVMGKPMLGYLVLLDEDGNIIKAEDIKNGI